jgi:hypothetical protein
MQDELIKRLLRISTTSANPFAEGDDHSSISEEALATKPTHPSLKDGVTEGIKIAAISATWVLATNVTAAIDEGGTKGLRTRLTFTGIAQGIPLAALYGMTATRVGLASYEQALSNNQSNSAILPIAAGASIEALTGNALDFGTLAPFYQTVQLTQFLQNNPNTIEGFSKKEMHQIMPKAPKNLSLGQLHDLAKSEKFQNINFGGDNAKLISQRTGTSLTLKDVAKALTAMGPYSVARNATFYHLLNKANSENTKEEQGGIGEIVAEGAALSLVTSVPNVATYNAATQTFKGKSVVEAIKLAGINGVKDVVTDPIKFTTLASIRFAATMAAVVIFSDATDTIIKKAVEQISAGVAKSLGIKGALKKEEKLAVDDVSVASVKRLEIISDEKPPATNPETETASQVVDTSRAR